MGRPRRDGAVLARGDGGEVPPRRFVGRARPARRSRTPRAGASAAAPRSTAACITGCPPSSPRSGQRTYDIDEFGPDALDRYAAPHRRRARRLAPARRAAGVVGRARARRGEARLAVGRVLARVPLRGERARGEADDGAHDAARARSKPARRSSPTAGCAALDAQRQPRRSVRAANARRPDGTRRALRRSAPSTSSCARGATQTPALLQRSGIRRNIGNGLKMHPTVKIAARFPHPIDHGDVPMHRVTEFAPGLTIGGSASRRGHVALALADSGADYADALADWETRRGVLRRDPQRGLRPRASRCPGCARRSSRTTSPKAT